MCVYRLKKTEGGELVKDPMTGGGRFEIQLGEKLFTLQGNCHLTGW